MDEDDEIAGIVAKHGWHATQVSDCPWPFVYTSGLLTTYRHPELIMFYRPSRSAYDFIALMVDDIAAGHSFVSESRYPDIILNYDVATKRVHPSQHELWLANAMGHCRAMSYHAGLAALQVFWPDKDGLFPFDAGCDKRVVAAQPLLHVALSPSEIIEFKRQHGIE